MKTLLSLFLIAVSLLPLSAAETNKRSYSMFPAPEAGEQRYIIEVPKQTDEADYRLQLFIGKEQMADCNQHVLSGKMERRELKGWGYHYYVVRDLNNGIHTMMICRKPAERRFVAMQSGLLRYNSRIGTVVYVPKGYTVRYRIWKAEEALHPAQAD